MSHRDPEEPQAAIFPLALLIAALGILAYKIYTGGL